VVSHGASFRRHVSAASSPFQSPDGDSVVSHKAQEGLIYDWVEMRGFSPLTGIPWFPTRQVDARFQSPDGDSVVSHFMRSISVGYAETGFQSPDGDSVVSHALENFPLFHWENSGVSVP